MDGNALTVLEGIDTRIPRALNTADGSAELTMSSAMSLPVARVAVNSPLPHLDRGFDYLVPPELDSVIVPGSRVRVRFAGRLVDAWVLQRRAASPHAGSLATLQRGIGTEPVLTSETSALFRAVADRWGGTFADVVRLGVPSRHARAESGDVQPWTDAVDPPQTTGWTVYRAGEAFVAAVRAARPARAVWSCLPGDSWPDRVAELVQTCLAGKKSAIVVVPDAREVAAVEAAFALALPSGSYTSLTSQLGPEARYRRWLAVRRGSVRAVVGTRAAVFAPASDLGLIVVFDDGDDLLAEPRAPYPHARDVAVLRASLSECALVIGGYARTAEAQLLLESGWAHEITADRSMVRARAPRVVAVGDDIELARDPTTAAGRLPAIAFRAARAALDAKLPVLVQVPRRGYAPVLACVLDRSPARCGHCHGPLAIAATGAGPSCRWCGRPATDWHCPMCNGTRFRAAVVGAARTAEEIGRAFASVVVRTSGGDSVLAEIPAGASLVIATPGAEPKVAGGYGAVLLLDGWAMLSRPDLRAGEETLRRWMNAAALSAPGARIIVGADAALAPVQGLIRWDPGGYAARELADRRELDFPPVSRFASLLGAPEDIARLLSQAQLPPSATELGVIEVNLRDGRDRSHSEVPGQGRTLSRALIRTSRTEGMALAEALHAAAAVCSAKRVGGPVRVALDPIELL